MPRRFSSEHTRLNAGRRRSPGAAQAAVSHITKAQPLWSGVTCRFVDPSRKYFSQRILTQNETVKFNNKSFNLKSLFPSGDHMVLIIDDSPMVWHFRPNLLIVPVRPPKLPRLPPVAPACQCSLHAPSRWPHQLATLREVKRPRDSDWPPR